MMHRRVFLHFSVAVLLSLFTLPGFARAEAQDDAKAFVDTLAQQAIGTMADKQVSEKERDTRFRQLFVKAFDISEIGKFVLSRYWRTASPEQQQEFLSLFEDITVLTWAKRFESYNGEKLEVLNANRETDKNGWTVDTRIQRAQQGQPPIPVQWRLHQAEDGSLRVIDIVVEGVSMAITYRSDYGSALQTNGGKLDGLLSTLRTKRDQLLAG